MTLDEKVDQLLQLATFFYEGSYIDGEITGPMEDLGINQQTIHNSGSVLGGSGASEVKSIQDAHLKTNRLNIPLLIMADIVHGFKTIFPVPLAIGSSFDLDLAKKSAEIAALEASVSGVHVTFAPMVDLVRDPRWGRVMESTGEDPFLNAEFAKVFVQGFQGDDLTADKHRVAACVKHFAAYGAPEGGRDYNTVDMSERQLREMYLPAYKAALEVGCEMVMTAFNTVDGVPATGNKKLMRDLLRDEWGFNGVIISDWGAVKELIPHGIAKDKKEAAKKALEAGVDIEMMTSCYSGHLVELVEEGQVDVALIDEAVLRILELKQKLGLFENPYRGANEQLEKDVIYSEEHLQVAYELATKSTVLLKNEQVLPLQKDQKVALVGPFANNTDILGPWSWQGSREKAINLQQGLETKLAASELSVAPIAEIEKVTAEELAQAIEISKEADVIIVALGEASEMSGEAGSLANIQLPQAQLELVSFLKKLNKPMVTVLFNGRPLDLHGVIDEADAVLEAWFPGSQGGLAIADLLYGVKNPSGKLSMSFPYHVGQVPVYYNHFNTGRPQGAPDAQVRYVSQYLDIPNEPLFPFGYGLSYTNFDYSNVKLSSPELDVNGHLTVNVTVTNSGQVEGEEVVQLYIRDLVGETVRPMKELKAFERINLMPNESKTVSFKIDEKMLRYHHTDLSFTSDAGEFEVFVGTNSQQVVSHIFTLKK
ncbi:glycoside hydrolase family 3 N-terminal domain-containing protein [Alkalihalobacillus pseudalcaliphilus]|uniref:glycoside hydrolase family 3 N-terminal domain-containing protein n=1 Tax=Alkalihalobacillus pseudalcaliphilus TaxID=79884 RepID=UPI00064D8ECB|nr:glycoside hydrolase family 3 N-terminal domain-containing protein [Alkalihalobacillus pseudalcaliphilus]KMK74823.1 glycosyl hydrolase family 3 [Alkalihalobacillus pseudalcaliphilus]